MQLNESSKSIDQLVALRSRSLEEPAGIQGVVQFTMLDGNGEVKWTHSTSNLITRVGDQYYGERAAGISGAPAQVTGMKLGTGTTAVAKTGAGAALVTYLAGTHTAIDATWPTSALSSSSRQIQWQCTFGPGVGTHAALAEVVLVNETLTDATSLAAATVARALISPTQPKNAADTLIIVWNHLLLGA